MIITLLGAALAVAAAAVRRARAAGREVDARRARAEAALRASEERFRLAFKTSPEPATLSRAGGRLVAVNDGFFALHGLTEEAALGRTAVELGIWLDPAERAAIGERLRRGEVIRGQDVRVRAGDGSTRILSFSASPIEIAGELHTFAMGRDVTEERARAAEQRRREIELGLLERLAAVGRVAAGVAHEINNPLTYVLANLEHVAERLREERAGPDLGAAVTEARDGAERVARIVRDLRVFARGPCEPDGRCAVGAVIRSATAIAGNEIRHRARLELDLAPAGDAAISEGRLAQVLVNLLANACHAIPEGRAHENEIRISAREVDRRAVIEVSDTGCGMTPEVRARVFEPFFTTRRVGEGMGLGLALSHAMVREAGGSIEVDSAPGRGSTFRIRLPLAAASAPDVAPPPPPAPAPAPAAPAPEGGRLRVLVVDDEPLVARSLARMLASHEVQVATSGAAAVETLGRGDRFDAVVCDLMMPEVTGMDVHAWVARARPADADRFVFVTGGAFSERARDFVARASRPVLEKPVDAHRLRAAVSAAGSGRALA